jgi:hypothetical protein
MVKKRVNYANINKIHAEKHRYLDKNPYLCTAFPYGKAGELYKFIV